MLGNHRPQFHDVIGLYRTIGLPVKGIHVEVDDYTVYLEKDNPGDTWQEGHSLNQIRAWLLADEKTGLIHPAWRLYCDAYPGQLGSDSLTYAGLILICRALMGEKIATDMLSRGPRGVDIFRAHLKEINEKWSTTEPPLKP